jgi:hypothetical protein
VFKHRRVPSLFSESRLLSSVYEKRFSYESISFCIGRVKERKWRGIFIQFSIGL